MVIPNLIMLWLLFLFLACVWPVSSLLSRSFLPVTRRLQPLKVVVPITSAEEFEEVMRKASIDRITIVDFQKSLCKPCKKVAPLFDELAKKYSRSVDFFKVDADSSPDCLALLKKNNIKSVPTFHVYVGSAKVDMVRGAHIELVEDAINREQVLIDKNSKRAGKVADELVDFPPDDDTEKARSRQNPGRVESLLRGNGK